MLAAQAPSSRAQQHVVLLPAPPARPAAARRRRRPRAASAEAAALVPYEPVARLEGRYDLRLLLPYAAAQVTYRRRDEGFLALGEYMSGRNASGARMLETQPVVMAHHPGGGKTMQVYAAPREPGAPLPQPADPAVTLEAAGGALVAVRAFSGYATREACEACVAALKAALAADGVRLAEPEAAGLFRLAQYGPLHSLSTRMNEIWLGVSV